MSITYKHNPARHYRDFNVSFKGNDPALLKVLELEYEETKHRLSQLLNSGASESQLRGAKFTLFLMSVGLFAFGRLDVAQDILDNVPHHMVRYKTECLVLTTLLPTPKNLDAFRDPVQVQQWLRVKRHRLKWSESLGRYFLENFRVLSSIPPNSNPKYFTVPENKSNQDGVIVEIFPDTENNWFACFQSGYSEFSGVYQHPNRVDLIIISNGQGYIVNPETEQLLEIFGGEIIETIEFLDSYAILFRHDSGFISYNETGFLWCNQELFWSGIRQLEVGISILIGECKRSPETDWEPFWLNVETGEIKFEEYDPVNDVIKSIKLQKRPWWQLW